jgi:hypothetical protein
MNNLSNLVYVGHRGDYIPNIIIPKNWQSGIKDFYKNRKDEKIEKDSYAFAEVLAGNFGKEDIQLSWNKEKGLDGICLSMQADIMLNEDGNWQEHNMNTKDSILALAILSNYYAELSKYIKENI